jgi:hypothetical protein
MRSVKLMTAGVTIGVLVTAAAAALAGTGTGSVFNLGETNTVNRTSTLAGDPSLNGSASDPELLVQNTGPGPAAAFVGAPGSAPFTVNSKNKVTKLNADQLDGYSSNELVRANRNGDSFEISMTAPSDGFVLVTGTAHGQVKYGTCVPCTFSIRLERDNLGTTRSPVTYGSVWHPSSADGTTSYANLADSWVFKVSAGQHKFELVPAFPGNPSGAELNLIADGLTALYEPYGPNGGGSFGG